MTESTHGEAPSLAGLRVLVTRPAGQSEALCQEIDRLGGTAIVVPALEIAAIEPDRIPVDHASDGNPDWIIFISANAARFGHEAALAFRAPHARVAAIGAATAACLADLHVEVDLCPESGGDSETLLSSTEFASINGRHVLIVRGRGGREALAEGLRARGAVVTYLEVYERRCPDACRTGLKRLADHAGVDVVTVTSGEALANLVAAAREGDCLPWLLALPLIVISPRIAATAREFGFSKEVAVAAEMSDRGFILTLKGCYSKKP